MIDLNTVKPEDLEFKMSSQATIAATGEGPRHFSGIGYSGEAILGHPYWGTVAFDLSGMSVPNPMPILMGHDPEKIVGFTQKVDTAITGLKLEGVLSKNTSFGKQVAELSDEGFPWQMSVRIKPSVLEEVSAGAFAEVNGRSIPGPCVVFRKSKVSETSFTPIGWDDKTSATALSFTHPILPKEDAMSAELEAKVAQLETDLLTSNDTIKVLTEKVAAYEAKDLQASKDARIADVKDLFTKMKRDFTEEAAAKYVAMSDDAFAIVKENIDEMAQTIVPQGLFSEKAKGEQTTTLPAKSQLEIDAENRANEYAKRMSK